MPFSRSSAVTVTVPGSPTSVTVDAAAKAAVGKPNTAISDSTIPAHVSRFSAVLETREFPPINQASQGEIRRRDGPTAEHIDTQWMRASLLPRAVAPRERANG